MSILMFALEWLITKKIIWKIANANVGWWIFSDEIMMQCPRVHNQNRSQWVEISKWICIEDS